MKPEIEFLKETKTKFPKELHHVLDEIAHSRPAFCCIGKLGSYVVGSVDSLAGAEGAFDFVSVPNGLGHIVVIFGWPWLFRRPAERLAVSLYLIDFQVFPVIPVHIYHVSEDGRRKATEALLKHTSVEFQVGAFVICVPTMMIDERVTLINAYANLGTELDFCLCLATYDGPYVRLKDADDAVSASMHTIREHIKLLDVHVEGGIECMLLMFCEKSLAARVVDKKLDNLFEFLVQATKHVGLGQTDKPAAFLFHLHKYEIGSAGILVRRAPVTNIQCLTNAMYISVHDLTAVMDDVDIYRVAYLCIGTSSVHLQHSFVASALRVCKLLGERIFLRAVFLTLFLGSSTVTLCPSIPIVVLAIALLRFGLAPFLLFKQTDSHFVYLLISDALADCDEQRGIENRLVGQLRETAHILHVWVLLDNLDGLLIREVHLVLDDHRGNNHPGWLVACTLILVVQFRVVDLLQFGPGKSIAQYDPTVGLVQAVKRRPEDIQRQLSVFILRRILHLLFSLTLQSYQLNVKSPNKNAAIF